MMNNTDLSIIITSFNNAEYLKDVITSVRVNFPGAQTFVIDDGSTDDSHNIIASFEETKYYTYIRFYQNRGYGSALKSGAECCEGKYIAFQDSDLEYDPVDIKKLYNAIKHKIGFMNWDWNCWWYPDGWKKYYGIAYGRRTHYGIRNPLAWLGRTIVNGLFYVMYGFKIRDVCTAYKVMPRQLLLDLDIQANDFRFSIELGAKLILGGYKVVEIPIDYYPRTTQEGKSIRWIDGINMIIAMIKWRIK